MTFNLKYDILSTMKQTITYDAEADEFTVTIKIPKRQSGEYPYDDGTWEVNNVCVFISRNHSEYSLNHEIYLDYKDSLQVGNTICYFDNQEEAELFAKQNTLNIHYGY